MKKSKIIFFILAILMLVLLVTLNQNNLESNTGKNMPGSYKSLTMMNAIRAYPMADIPEDGYTRAFEYSRMYLASSSRDVLPWEPIGPGNIGGRTLDISLNQQNPNTIYAASASGGLWRSYTGGVGENVWERLELGYPGLAIGAVEVSPADSNVIFVGTGECYGYGTYFPSISFRATRGLSGIGLLRSTDNGLTWEKSIDWSYNQQQGVQRVKFDPVNSDIVWAATTQGTYKSVDIGVTWELVNEIPMATDIAINPEDPDIVILACGGMYSTGNGIYRTTNGGDTWLKQFLGTGGPATFGGKARVMIAQSSPNIVYVSVGKSQSTGSNGTWLCKSEDYGETWEVINTTDYSSYQGWYSHYVGVSPFNENKLFCGGVDMYQSSNGGNSMFIKDGIIQDWFHPDWLHLDHHDIEFHPTDSNIIYFAQDGGVHRTDDGGETFFSCNWGYQTSQFYPGFSCSDTDSLNATGGLQDNFSCMYQGGYYWKRVAGGDGSWTALNQENNDNVFHSSQYLNIYRSYNNGLNYTNVSPTQGTNTNFIAPFLLSPVDNQTMYAGRSIIFRSNNNGSNWTPTNASSQFNDNPVLNMAMSSTSTEVVYAATMAWNSRAQIFRTTDGGDLWEDITGDLPDLMITDIHVDVNNHDRVFVTLGGFGSSHLFMSENSGDTWNDIGSTLPDIPGWCVINDPTYPQIIYFGNEFGVYISYDNGESWTEFIDGFGDGVFAMDLKISVSNQKLRVATHGNGVWEIPLEVISKIDDNISLTVNDLEFINYPNPFTNETSLQFKLTGRTHVNISVFDISGRLVDEVTNSEFPAGKHGIIWKIDDFQSTNNEFFLCRLIAGGQNKTLKLQVTGK